MVISPSANRIGMFGGMKGHGTRAHLLSVFGLVGSLETFGSFLLTLGLLTAPVAFIMADEMTVAYFKVHFSRGFCPSKTVANRPFSNLSSSFISTQPGLTQPAWTIRYVKGTSPASTVIFIFRSSVESQPNSPPLYYCWLKRQSSHKARKPDTMSLKTGAIDPELSCFLGI